MGEYMSASVKLNELFLGISDGAAYSARTAHPFRKNGAPFRLKLSSAQF